jgi:hypothetical protein
MPSLTHDAILELFRRRPTLAGEILGKAFPSHLPPLLCVDVADSSVGSSVPIERTADLVLLFSSTADAAPERAVVLEVQLDVDPDKRRSWWWYLAFVHTRHQCEALLVVVTLDARVAAWAAKPIELGHPGATLRPLVIGPADVPIVRDVNEAIDHPELAVLSAVVHGHTDAADDIARAAFAAVQPLDDPRAVLYTDLVIISLRASARAILEDLMAVGTYQFQSDFAKRYYGQGLAEGETRGRAEGETRGRAEGETRGRAEGETRGRAEGETRGRAGALITILETRGLQIPPELRARILACTDVATLDVWLARAVTAKTADDVVAE